MLLKSQYAQAENQRLMAALHIKIAQLQGELST